MALRCTSSVFRRFSFLCLVMLSLLGSAAVEAALSVSANNSGIVSISYSVNPGGGTVEERQGSTWVQVGGGGSSGSFTLTRANGTYSYQLKQCYSGPCSVANSASVTVSIASSTPSSSSKSSTPPSRSSVAASGIYITASKTTLSGQIKINCSVDYYGGYAYENNTKQGDCAIGGSTFDVNRVPGTYTFWLWRVVGSSGSTNPAAPSGCSACQNAGAATVTISLPTLSPITAVMEPISGVTTLSYSSPDGPSYYLVTTKYQGSIIANAQKVTATNLIMMAVTNPGNYTYVIQACSVVNACSAGTESNAVYFPVPPPASIQVVPTDVDGQFAVQWPSVSSASFYVLEQRQSGGNYTEVYRGSERNYGALVDAGGYTFRVKSCQSSTDCSANYRESTLTTVTGSTPSAARRVIFLHTDLLGSPAAETNENGAENE